MSLPRSSFTCRRERTYDSYPARSRTRYSSTRGEGSRLVIKAPGRLINQAFHLQQSQTFLSYSSTRLCPWVKDCSSLSAINPKKYWQLVHDPKVILYTASSDSNSFCSCLAQARDLKQPPRLSSAVLEDHEPLSLIVSGAPTGLDAPDVAAARASSLLVLSLARLPWLMRGSCSGCRSS